MNQEFLKSILDYDAESGVFTWINPKRKSMKDKVAGFIFRINSKYYKVVLKKRGS